VKARVSVSAQHIASPVVFNTAFQYLWRSILRGHSFQHGKWRSGTELNRQPPVYKTGVLPLNYQTKMNQGTERVDCHPFDISFYLGFIQLLTCRPCGWCYSVCRGLSLQEPPLGRERFG
jgi:hypothetical protein